VRALLAAHLQATVNRSRKELGKVGATLMAVLIGSFAILALVPLVLGSGVVGWVVGGALDQPKGVYILGGLLTALSAGGGILGGVLGGTRTLSWESYRVFPLRFRSLFAGELLAGLGDSLPLVLSCAMTALLLGIAVAHPRLLPLVVALALASTLVLLLLQLLVGFLAAALVKRLQVALLLLGVITWTASVLSLKLPGAMAGTGGAQVDRLKLLGRALLRALDTLPTTQAAYALSVALKGAWGSALLRSIYPLAGALALLALTAWAMSREASTATGNSRVQGPARERLWTFHSPVEGLARLQWRTLLTSHVGKFGFLIPLMTVVLLKGPLGHAKHQEVWGLPAAFLYLGLTVAQLQFNQFGLDGHGVKALLLLPVPARHLLAGKCLGLAVYQGAQALLLALLLSLVGKWTPLAMLGVLLLSACVFLAQAGLGHWTSAWLPRPMPRDSLKNSNVALPVMLVGMAASSTFAALFGGTYALLAWLAPAWLVPGMGALFGLTLLAYLGLLPRAAAYLDSRREQVMAALG
jgi:hypothetical protein